MLRRRKERVRLVDDSAFLIQREKPHERKEEPQFRSERHKAWIKTLPCVSRQIVHDGPIDPAHVRIGTDGGGSVKPSDYFTLPLCRRCHKAQHLMGERSFHRLFTDGLDDPARYALTFARRSPCGATASAADAEWGRRGYV